MNDIDRQKVLTALMCCGDYLDCAHCPYAVNGSKCRALLHLHALALLQPRLLTLEETQDAGVVWLEDKGLTRLRACAVSVYPDRILIKCFGDMETGDPGDFGHWYRFWSQPPTREQWEAEPWQE